MLGCGGAVLLLGSLPGRRFECKGQTDRDLTPGVYAEDRFGTPDAPESAGELIAYLFVGTADNYAVVFRFLTCNRYHMVIG